jgi:uncharacterized membrane protein (UPF0127 family)
MRRLRIDRICRRTVQVRVVGGGVLLEKCRVGDTPVARLVGLLGTPRLRAGEGLIVRPCSSIHTVGMRWAIACAFVDGSGTVVRVVDPLPPLRFACAHSATAVVEASAGSLTHLAPGERLVFAARAERE